jgi:hypothetical protein
MRASLHGDERFPPLRVGVLRGEYVNGAMIAPPDRVGFVHERHED